MQRLNSFEFFKKNQNITNLAAYLLVGVMSICLLWMLVNLGEQIQPTWRGGYLRVFGILLVVEALLSRQVIESFDEKKGWIFRLSEFGLILFGLKFAQFLNMGWSGMMAQLGAWQVRWWNFFDGEYLLAVSLAVLIWVHTTRYTHLLSVLNSYESDLEIVEFVQLRAEREEARAAMVNLYLAVGLVLILLLTMIRSDAAFLERMRGELINHSLSLAIVPLVLYFVSGLVLLSLSRFAILRGGWLISKLPIQAEIGRNWFKYALIFFGLVSLFTLFLPTSYTSGFLATSYQILQWIVEFAMFILGLIIFPFVWLYSLIMSLLPESNNEPPTAEIPKFEAPEQVQTTTTVMSGWFEMLQHIFFWVLLIVVLFLVIRHYVKENKTFFEKMAVITWVKNWMKGFWSWIKKSGQNILDRFPQSLKQSSQEQAEKTSLFDWFSTKMRGNTPRERIIERYLSFLNQSTRLGVKKKPSSTPDQFAKQVNPTLTEESQSDLAEITAGFIRARYSAAEIKQDEVDRLEPLWKRILNQIKRNLNG